MKNIQYVYTNYRNMFLTNYCVPHKWLSFARFLVQLLVACSQPSSGGAFWQGEMANLPEPQMEYKYGHYMIYLLVGGFNPSEKY